MIISFCGNGIREFMSEALTLSFASFIALSGSPTISKHERLLVIWHSTVTKYPSIPSSPALYATLIISYLSKLILSFSPNFEHQFAFSSGRRCRRQVTDEVPFFKSSNVNPKFTSISFATDLKLLLISLFEYLRTVIPHLLSSKSRFSSSSLCSCEVC